MHCILHCIVALFIMVIQASPSQTAPTDSVDQVDQMMDLDRGTATATPPTTADAAMSFLRSKEQDMKVSTKASSSQRLGFPSLKELEKPALRTMESLFATETAQKSIALNSKEIAQQQQQQEEEEEKKGMREIKQALAKKALSR